jgi:hypothetical protein
LVISSGDNESAVSSGAYQPGGRGIHRALSAVSETTSRRKLRDKKQPTQPHLPYAYIPLARGKRAGQQFKTSIKVLKGKKRSLVKQSKKSGSRK